MNDETNELTTKDTKNDNGGTGKTATAGHHGDTEGTENGKSRKGKTAKAKRKRKEKRTKAPEKITAEELREIIPGAILYNRHGMTPCPRCLVAGIPLREHRVVVDQTFPSSGLRRMRCRHCQGEILSEKQLPAVAGLMEANGYCFKAVESKQQYESYLQAQDRERLATLRADLQTAETVMKHKHVARERAFREYAEARRRYRKAEAALKKEERMEG